MTYDCKVLISLRLECLIRFMQSPFLNTAL